MATTLGGVTLADPLAGTEGHEVRAVGEGATMAMADGSIVYDYTTTRYRFTLRWRGLTSAQRDTIRTRYLVKTSQAYSPPESAGTYTVYCAPNTWREASWVDGDGSFRYDCEMSLEEVS